MKNEIILKDFRTDDSDIYNPYFWQNDDIIASVLLEPYWLDEAQKKSIKATANGSVFDLLDFAKANEAKVVLRISAPSGSQEIAFPFIYFTSIFKNTDYVFEIFERTVKRYLKSKGYDNVVIKKGKRESIIKNYLRKKI